MSRTAIDVSALPTSGFDTRAPIWWGNLWMIVIESTMFAIVVASYFYLRQNFPEWPPPRTEPPSILHPSPDLAVGTGVVVALLASCLPMAWADRSARRHDERGVLAGLGMAVLLGVVALALRFLEFRGLHVRWDSNAYGSIVWTALGFHVLHIMSSTIETALLEVWIFVHGMDDRHSVDTTVNAFYWYWMAGVWIPIYAILYFVPRLQ
jgi:heme/copper-type cytochrome/quinol oxidase subunit 3